MPRHPREDIDLLFGAVHVSEYVAQTIEHFGAAIRTDVEKLLNLGHLIVTKPKTGNVITGLVGVSRRQFEPYLVQADPLEFVQNPKDVVSGTVHLLLRESAGTRSNSFHHLYLFRDRRVLEQEIQYPPAGTPHPIGPDV